MVFTSGACILVEIRLAVGNGRFDLHAVLYIVAEPEIGFTKETEDLLILEGKFETVWQLHFLAEDVGINLSNTWIRVRLLVDVVIVWGFVNWLVNDPLRDVEILVIAEQTLGLG